ncbi:MAG TPA: hypothetical protein VGL35_12710, partial [Rhizomicrobium sp.]
RSDANAGNPGGGLSNLTVEAGGLTSGPAVEIDGGGNQVFANLEVRDAVGGGNAVFRCGHLGDPNADAGGNWYTNIRAETDQRLFGGAQMPDADIEMTAGCHDSFLAKPIAVNASVANIEHVAGGALHIDNPHTFNALHPDVQGSADYGIATAEHDYILGAQTDDARFADIYLAPETNQASHGQRLVEPWLNCAQVSGAGAPAAFSLNTEGDLTNGSSDITGVPTVTGAAVGMIVAGTGIPLGDTIVGISSGPGPYTISLAQAAALTQTSAQITVTGGFRGIEISSGDSGATVTATSDEPACSIADSAIIQQDGTADPSTAVFGNGHASYSTLHSVYGPIVYSTTNVPGTSTLSNEYHACVDTSAAAATITLPSAPSVGLQYTVDDCTGTAGTHHITIMPATGFIDGSPTYVIGTNQGSWTGYYASPRWKTVASH